MSDETEAPSKHRAAPDRPSSRSSIDPSSATQGRPHLSSRIFAFGPESEEQLLEETILAWQAQGPAAAWQATFDLLAWWFEARGLDPEAQRVDRAHNEIHRVPWMPGPEAWGDDA